MRKIFLLFLAVALTGMFSAAYAQTMGDEALSAQYKHEISVLDSQIKTVKIQLKANPDNVDLKTDLATKQAELKALKSKKSVVDAAIKSKKSAEKAAKKAEDARLKAERNAADAQKLKEEAQKKLQATEPVK